MQLGEPAIESEDEAAVPEPEWDSACALRIQYASSFMRKTLRILWMADVDPSLNTKDEANKNMR